MVPTMNSSPLSLAYAAALLLACAPDKNDPPAGTTGATTEPATTTTTDPTTSGATTGVLTEPTTTGATSPTTTGPTTTGPTTTGPTTTGPTTTDATTDTADDTTGSGVAVCPEHSLTDACCCFKKVDQLEDYTANVCPAPKLCGLIEVVCDDFDIGSCPLDLLTTKSDTAIDCALQALVDGEAGEIVWFVSSTFNPGQSGHRAVLLPVGDGTAFRAGYSFFDLGASVEAVTHLELKPKDFFLDCLTMPTAIDRFVCLREGRIGEPVETCIAGYDADFF